MTKRRFMNIVAAVLAVTSAIAAVLTPVFAEGETPTFNSDTTANLTIKYFDDEDETVPASGSEFTVYQIATIGHDLDNNGAYVYLDDTLNLDEVNDEVSGQAALDYEKKVLAAYEANPELGYTNKVTIGDDGLGILKGIPTGAYLITETKTIRYHIRSIPFVASTPEVEDGKSWNFDITVNPKVILAGDLAISKQVVGKELSKNATYTVKLNIEAGSYKYENSNGKSGYAQNNSKLKIKNGETITIYDLPAGTTYTITELEENKGYDTTYKLKTSSIEAKKTVNAKIVNDSTRYDTGEANKMIFYIVGAGASLAIILLLVVTAKQNKKNKAE